MAKEHAPTSGEYFRLLARLLNHAHHTGIAIHGVDRLFEVELDWLLKIRVGRCPREARQSSRRSSYVLSVTQVGGEVGVV